MEKRAAHAHADVGRPPVEETPFRGSFLLLTHAYACFILVLALGRDWAAGSWGGRGMEKDRRGRRRQPNQERGLRPLHPLLPRQWTSKALRVAMSQEDWARFEALVRGVAPQVPTLARAQGAAISGLMDRADVPRPAPGPLDWMDWERQKTLRLLRSAI